jgi:hypothetical protein
MNYVTEKQRLTETHRKLLLELFDLEQNGEEWSVFQAKHSIEK